MDTSAIPSSHLPPLPQPPSKFEPDTQNIKQKLTQKGVFPSPRILRNLSKKEIQKHNRKAKRRSLSQNPPLTESQQQALAEESHFQTLKREYKSFNKAIASKGAEDKFASGAALLVGKPWEGIERVRLKELASSRSEAFNGENTRRENLKELREMFERDLSWVLEDDVDLQGLDSMGNENREWDPEKRWPNEREAIRVLVSRLSSREITEKHWKFVRMMKQSGLQFTEKQLLKILEGLGGKGSWRQALAIVQWVYSNKERIQMKSRFVYTKLLSVLGNARRPHEALQVFNIMLGDRHIYPDIAAYHSIAVTLGQAGFLKELVKLIDCMRQKPSKNIKHMRHRNWDPELEPDLVVYNAVLNACVPSHQWKGVSWVFQQLRKSGLKPKGATYGLAMEVMLESGKYDLVHVFFMRMRKSGEAPKAITYKVLVRALWKEGKINEAVEAVRDMERRGIIGAAGVYYELACSLCYYGRWRDAMAEVEKIKKLPHCRPLAVTFTGLITSSMDGGHIDDCTAIFHYMKDQCVPNIGTINAMLKVYGWNDMFSEAKELFEKTKRAKSAADTSPDYASISLTPDKYTYSSMLEASARSLQWEYFEYVYKEMILSGYQLDQTRQAVLLVEASRAGKWYLLEHAFDSLLEAGEIPHQLFFTEMLFHAISQDKYKRAVTLINTMAFAPFQVSERQWTDLFEKNGDRITQENIRKLLDALHNSNTPSEATVSNLLRSLSSLCGFVPSRDFSNTISSTGEAANALPVACNDVVYDDPLATNVANSASIMGFNTNMGKSYPDELSTKIKRSDRKDDVYRDMAYNPSSNSYKNNIDDSVIKETSDDAEDFLDKELSALNLLSQDMAINEGDEYHHSKQPTAQEILEEWKESRYRDGILFPFQLGQK